MNKLRKSSLLNGTEKFNKRMRTNKRKVVNRDGKIKFVNLFRRPIIKVSQPGWK